MTAEADRLGTPVAEQIGAINHAEFDDANDPYWRLTVYEAVHGGRRFANIGGRRTLELIGGLIESTADREVLELGSGIGDTCLYLADRFDCRVTGIELNERQFVEAVSGLDRADPALAERVRFLNDDILRWSAPSLYDVVFALDSLIYIADAARVLRMAAAALRTPGRLVIADLVAGPQITPEVREFIWEQDGILHLPTAEAQVRAIKEAGLEQVELEDLTDVAAECFATVTRASLEHRKVLIAAKGRRRYESWLANARTYGQYFRDRILRYVQIIAQR